MNYRAGSYSGILTIICLISNLVVIFVVEYADGGGVIKLNIMETAAAAPPPPRRRRSLTRDGGSPTQQVESVKTTGLIYPGVDKIPALSGSLQSFLRATLKLENKTNP